MPLPLKLLGILAACVFIAASGAMNWAFLSGQGHTPLEAQILGGVSLGVTAMNVILPFRIAASWKPFKPLALAVSGVAFALCLSFALLSAVGFAAMSRGAVSGDRDALNSNLVLAEKELGEVDAQLMAMGVAARASNIIEQELAAQRLNPRWQSSRECADATAVDSRRFCADYFKLKAELEGALDYARKLERQAKLRGEVKRLKGQGAGQDADPQVSIVTKLMQRILPAADAADVKLSLILYIAVLVEFLAAFGLYLALGVGHGGKRDAGAGAGERLPVEARRMSVVPGAVIEMEAAAAAPATEAKAADSTAAVIYQPREPERLRPQHIEKLLASIEA